VARQTEFRNKLTEDQSNGTSPTKPVLTNRKQPEFTASGEYINKIGWSGLNIGGAATGNTASVLQLGEKVCL
jgi:hypothetical protein